MSKTFAVTVTENVRHDGVLYGRGTGAGDTIAGLTRAQVERLERARVVGTVKAEKVKPPAPPAPPDPPAGTGGPEPTGITLDDVLGANARDAIVLIGQVDEVPLLQAVIDRDDRATVKAAAQARLASPSDAE